MKISRNALPGTCISLKASKPRGERSWTRREKAEAGAERWCRSGFISRPKRREAEECEDGGWWVHE